MGESQGATRPTPGNHNTGSVARLLTTNLGGAGRTERQGIIQPMSWAHGTLVVLNTNCDARDWVAVRPGRRKTVALRQDLADHRGSCMSRTDTMALSAAGFFGECTCIELRRLWRTCTRACGLILAGRSILTSDLLPQARRDDRIAARHPGKCVGTGGESHDPLGLPGQTAKKKNYDTYGVLKLTLSPAELYVGVRSERRTFRIAGTGFATTGLQGGADCGPAN